MNSERKRFLIAYRSQFATMAESELSIDELTTQAAEAAVVSVMVRGEVTLRTLDTWRKLLQRVALPLEIRDNFSSDTTYVVLDAVCDETRFLTWSKLSCVPDSEKVHVVSPEWLIRSLQRKNIENWREYLHPLQRETTAGKETPVEQTSTLLKSSPQPSIGFTSIPTDSVKLACERTSKVDNNLNAHITSPLESLLEHYELQHDDFRAKAYKRAIGKLKHLDFKVTDLSQVMS